MKLLTFVAPGGAVHIGALLPGELLVADLTASGELNYFANMLQMIDAGEAALQKAREIIAKPTARHKLSEVRLLAPIPQPRRLRDCLCYEMHLRQCRANRYLFGVGTGPLDPAKVDVPRVWYDRPIYYKGNTFNIVGTGAEIHWPTYSTVIDYELELCLVTGRGGKNISTDDALKHVFGYTIFNDFSARDALITEISGSLGPAKGKDFDTGNAIGPWIVTADEIKDPKALTLVARVNGVEWSRNSSQQMQHDFADIISYVSSEETLYPGELLGCGTVGGGCGNEIGKFLKDGDVIDLEVIGIGTLTNRIVAPHVKEPPPFPIRLPI